VRAVPSPRELHGPGLEESARQFFALVTEACILVITHILSVEVGKAPATVVPWTCYNKPRTAEAEPWTRYRIGRGLPSCR